MIHDTIDGTATENHKVLGERTSFVANNVLDLAKLIGKVPRFRHSAPAHFFVVHVMVLENEKRLNGPHNFKRDVKGNRHNVLKSNQRVGK